MSHTKEYIGFLWFYKQSDFHNIIFRPQCPLKHWFPLQYHQQGIAPGPTSEYFLRYRQFFKTLTTSATIDQRHPADCAHCRLSQIMGWMQLFLDLLQYWFLISNLSHFILGSFQPRSIRRAIGYLNSRVSLPSHVVMFSIPLNVLFNKPRTQRHVWLVALSLFLLHFNFSQILPY